ncbi:MAG: PHP domain-containing protein [Candidatus Eremiobacteraeota bacterium]|nr:PHP domain-containing protein [Candidatus Eremiobacteraeota bacterium]MBV9646925.1 PHP domain-containing protein [Candidatus Eremiobacteraeota bacterium]
MLVDFHCHTRESDGSLTPAELVEAMRARGVGVFSVTDHDTLAAYATIADVAWARIVVGIEINTTYRGGEVHVLGYGMQLDDGPLRAMLERNCRARGQRIAKIVAQLNRVGIDLSLEQVRAEAAPQAPLGRPHVAKALVRNAYVPTIDGAFRSLLSRDRPGYVPSVHATPQEAIDVIAGAGGIPVLAHPGRLRDEDVIDELADAGLLGLEVFYPTHTLAQVERFRERARGLGLVLTGGSDFHDARYGAGVVGVEAEPDDIAPFLDMVSSA